MQQIAETDDPLIASSVVSGAVRRRPSRRAVCRVRHARGSVVALGGGCVRAARHRQLAARRRVARGTRRARHVPGGEVNGRAVTAPPQRLAIFRCLVGAFAVVYLLVRFPAFWTLAGRSAHDFEPVGVLSWLDAPLPALLWRGLLVACLAFGIAFTAGFRFRACGPTFAVLLLVITTYRSSWGQLLYFENLLVLHTLIVGLARSADTFTIPRRGGGTHIAHNSNGHHSNGTIRARMGGRFGWPRW